ncbi:hypothetical protein CS006_05385 [Bifidobacterium primatium]|uniref:SpoVT-AbrB domain-containing protein n=1 Tax=Bifidobacterium primatium TaxID=2045438 RepID=A0A2M9H9F4_9BIFI|nr:AbrB/MazE/SpoVT family DNA-binding domain-containing protein [Bifidobacterium primatium]PJM73468.1 hypothetical protein CS006_05385 [Bifidobacterium primatium]
MTSTAVVATWGNSEAIRIPKEIREQTGISAGSYVTLDVEDGNIVIRPVSPKTTRVSDYNVPDLRDLFADWRGTWQPEEDGFAAPVGQEAM